MKSLRVLHASPTWFSADSIVGGGERWVDNVMRAISVGAPWIDQTMVAIGAEPSLALRGKFAVRVLANERESRAPMDAISSRLWDEFASFDVIHIHQTLTDFGAYACCIAASLRKTIVVTDLGGGNNPVMVNGGLALADGVLSISNYAHARIASDVRSHSLVIIGPIDTDAFHPADRPPPDPAAICVGRIMPHKGIDRLIRALPTGLKLRVVGRVYHEPYRRVLGELAAGKDVEFIHDAADQALTEYYHRSSLFLQASCTRDLYGNIAPNTELMGLTTLEAMACGLPVIVSADGGSLPELITDPAFGRVFATEAELENLLRQHQAGLWPVNNAANAARAHAIASYGLIGYGQRLAQFYADIHASRLNSCRCAS
jgi:glycosyltransferase involved in cell wall biosynthesis